ncbi:hypothetical protein [Nocardia pseudovaccinii]|uniref:hypothetical protein n=1 Tax=Nocardia pseudovaccinii TaxID=189540 RepID=UPI0007A4BE7E|nr:hypothetical protein [Nocardia pseudovaccinii]
MDHTRPAPQQRRFELGQTYRPINLQPGTIVVREANRSPRQIVTGSPCCRHLVHLDLDVLEWQITQRAKGFAVVDFQSRRCPDCRAGYRLRFPGIDTVAALHLASTVEWEVFD